jgi:hypothetical protein
VCGIIGAVCFNTTKKSSIPELKKVLAKQTRRGQIIWLMVDMGPV